MGRILLSLVHIVLAHTLSALLFPSNSTSGFKIWILSANFTELEYLLLGLVSAVPSFLIPMLLVGKADGNLHWKDRYWVKKFLTNNFMFTPEVFPQPLHGMEISRHVRDYLSNFITSSSPSSSTAKHNTQRHISSPQQLLVWKINDGEAYL
ncbi:hypothetical protein AHAS_Ahas18G0296600 [Arachis hypogaea]